MEYSKEWKGIVELYQRTKSLLLFAEEYNLSWKTFLQPLLEQRSALDHICRAMAVETRINAEGNHDEVPKNLDKAKGHLYRAFFDTADWLSIELRNSIIEGLNEYDSECIKKAIPNYYSKIRPDIVEINEEIAEARNNKDVTSRTGTIEQIEKYTGLIDKLSEYYKQIIKAKESLEELKNEQRKKSWKSIIIQIVVGLLLIVVSTIAGAVLL